MRPNILWIENAGIYFIRPFQPSETGEVCVGGV